MDPKIIGNLEFWPRTEILKNFASWIIKRSQTKTTFIFVISTNDSILWHVFDQRKKKSFFQVWCRGVQVRKFLMSNYDEKISLCCSPWTNCYDHVVFFEKFFGEKNGLIDPCPLQKNYKSMKFQFKKINLYSSLHVRKWEVAVWSGLFHLSSISLIVL